MIVCKVFFGENQVLPYRNKEKQLFISAFLFLCTFAIGLSISFQDILENKEALCLSCDWEPRKFAIVAQGRHGGSHAMAWAAISIYSCYRFS